MRTLLAIVLAVVSVGYLLPTSIALVRGAPVLLCFLVNALLGWTVIGWIAALVLSFRPPDID